MARRIRQDDAPGSDSFLDVVANLVGILIILVMVVGMQAKEAYVEAGPQAAAEEPAEADDSPNEDELDPTVPRAEADAIQADINQLDSKLAEQQLEVEFRRRERNQIHLLMTALESELANLRGGLDETQRDQLERQAAIAAKEQELNRLADDLQALESAASTPGVIEHLPTPMAKTVFGKEYHFRLLGKRLTYVPLDELVDKMKAEAPDKLWKLKDAEQLTETVGPLDGFWLKYTLARTQYTQPTRSGTVSVATTRVELDHFSLVPVSDDIGEPFQQALADGSRFRGFIDGLDPKRATITIWVYPDSFDEFRELKRILFNRGFLTAGRPMPAGMPIGGSPDGTRSSAQ